MLEQIIVNGDLREANKIATLLYLADTDFNYSLYDLNKDSINSVISDLQNNKTYKHIKIKNVSRETDLIDLLKAAKHLPFILTCNIDLTFIINKLNSEIKLITIKHLTNEKETYLPGTL